MSIPDIDTRALSIVILDGQTVNPGDNSWKPVYSLGRLTVYDRTSDEEVVQRSKDADILISNKVRLDGDILQQLPRCKYITLLSTGYNQIDIKTAGRLNIPVSNVPDYSTDSVAQFTFALLLALCHRIEEHDWAVHGAEWSLHKDFSFWKTPQVELAGKTMGIVGYGSIGSKVGYMAHGFGMNVLAFNPNPKEPPSYEPFAFVPLSKLFSSSDVVSLHCPLTEDNKEFVNKRRLSSMKRTSMLINTARGGLINESDLSDSLNEGSIAGAALDVVSQEPIPLNNPLLLTNNLIITPHMAWASLSARQRLVQSTADNISCYLQGKPQNIINRQYLQDPP